MLYYSIVEFLNLIGQDLIYFLEQRCRCKPQGCVNSLILMRRRFHGSFTGPAFEFACYLS